MEEFPERSQHRKRSEIPGIHQKLHAVVIPVVVAIIYLKGYYDMFQPKGNAYLIPWMIVGIAMLALTGWISFGHSKKK